MSRPATLKDGSEVVIRPMTEDDLDGSYEFFQLLGDEDRAYLCVDVSKREIVADRIRAMRTGRVKRLVAVSDDRIVADGAVELEGAGWREHMGEIRLIVAPNWQRKGLGMVMARELYQLAVSGGVEGIVVKMMRPQVAVQDKLPRFGLRDETTLRNYVKDIEGKRHNLIVIHCDPEVLWRELEDHLTEGDWQRAH